MKKNVVHFYDATFKYVFFETWFFSKIDIITGNVFQILGWKVIAIFQFFKILLSIVCQAIFEFFSNNIRINNWVMKFSMKVDTCEISWSFYSWEMKKFRLTHYNDKEILLNQRSIFLAGV